MSARMPALVGITVLTLVVAVSAAGGTVATTYRDAAGDVRGVGGPDIVSVTVSHDARRVTFTVRFATAPPLGVGAREQWVDMLLVGIDVPPLGPAPVPSSWRGVDYFFGLHGKETVARFAPMTTRVLTPLPVVVRGATLRVSVPRARIGNPKWFGFTLAAAREAEIEAKGSADYAPAKGLFRYALAA